MGRAAAAAAYPVCPHVDDVELAYWYAEHPEVICARCWLEAKGGRIRATETKATRSVVPPATTGPLA